MSVRTHAAALAVLTLAALAAACSPRAPVSPGQGATGTPTEETRTATPTAEWPELSLERRWEGLEQPLDVRAPADGSGRLYVVEKTGRVRELLGDGSVARQPFLDVSALVSDGGEQGLLGLAFSPGFAQDRLLFVNYTDRAGDTAIVRYEAVPDGTRADPASAVTVLTVDQPYSNHNGGCVLFGPDGMLYIGMGDGGSAGDPHGNGRNAGVLLGKMLRLDVGATGTPLPAGRPYRVPPDNPYVDTAGARPEVWAKGLRNPWRFSFDRQTGDLWIADVGQNRREEIDFAEAGTGGGRDYGWNLYEGSLPFPADGPVMPKEGLTFPVAEYGRDAGASVSGGVVYRGNAHPTLRGVYLYSDWVSGRVWGLRRAGTGWQGTELLDTDYAISSFGEDADGEVYACDMNGAVYRVTAR